MRAASLAVLVACSGLAGCLGAEAPANGSAPLVGAASSSGAGALPQGLAGAPNGTVAVDLGGEAVHRLIEQDGAFEGTDAWWPAHFALWVATQQDQPSAQVLDITGQVPRGVPVRIRAAVDGQVTHGTMGVFVGAAETEYYGFEANRDGPGAMWVEVLLVHTAPDPVVVGVTYGDPEPAAQVPYHLTVNIDYDPLRLPAGIPLGLRLAGAGAALRFAFPDGAGEEPAVLLFDPADRLLGRFPVQGEAVEVELPDDAVEGEYVVLLAQPGGDAVVEAQGLVPESPPRTLGQELTWGQPHAVQGATEATWSFDVPRAPVQVCMNLRGAENFLLSHRGSIASPLGEVVAFDHAGDFWTFSNSWWCTGMGQENLVPGSYDAAFAANPGINVEVTEVVVHYAR